MPDLKITQLPAVTAVTADDLLVVVNDPAGVAETRKAAISVLDDRYLNEADNLSDLDNVATARINLGLTIGSQVQGWDADLDAIAALGSTGFPARTAANTWALRTLIAPAAGLTITNPAGVAGDPTFVLANDLSALEGLSTTGLAVRSASDTWLTRSIAAGTALGVTNGDGIAGNPTVAVTDVELLALAGLTSAADKLPYFTGSGTAALADFTTFARTLVDDADAAAARTTLGLGSGGAGDIWVEKAGDTMTGALTITVEDNITYDITTALTIGHNTPGSPLFAGFGPGLLFQGESSVAENQNMARIGAAWSEPTHASRSADIVFQTVDSANDLADVARMYSNGNMRIHGDLGVGTSPFPGVRLFISRFSTATSGEVYNTFYYNQIAPTTASSATFQTLTAQSDVYEGATGDMFKIVAFNSTSNVYAPITVTHVVGAEFLGGIGAGVAATITNASGFTYSFDAEDGSVGIVRGLNVKMADVDTGSITGSSSGLYIRSATLGSGSIALQNGIYIEDISLAASNFAILTNAGNVVLNEGGDADTDFRVEGDTDVNLLFTDASTDRVGIGMNNPAHKLDITGALNVSDKATTRTNLGIAIGSNVQAFDAFLTSIALLGTAADRMIYTTGVDTAAETALTAFARSILDDANEATFKATVNLEIGTDVQAWDAGLDGVAGLGDGNLGFMVKTGASTVVNRSITVAADGLTITNGSGVSGNPLIELAGDLQAVESLLTTGIAVRSAADTWLTRTLTAGNNIAVTNGTGAAGNPTIAATASGSDTQIQFNDGGTNFGADAGLLYDKTNDLLAITDAVASSVTRTLGGLELRVSGVVDLSTTFAPGVKWMSTDVSFTTENPKFLAGIIGQASEEYAADTDGGMALNFYVTEDNPGATNIPNLAMKIYSTGRVNVGPVLGGDAQLAIIQNVTTAAVPSLYLSQEDVSEEFIRFKGTSANGVLTQSIVEDADVVTATRAGWIKVFVQDDGNQLTDQAYFLPVFTIA